YRRALPHRLGHGQTKPFADGLLQDNCGSALQGIYQRRILDGQNTNPLLRAIMQRLEYLLPLWIVRRDIPNEDQSAIDLLSRDSKGRDHALGVFPTIEARDLRDQWQIGGDIVVRQALIDVGV